MPYTKDSQISGAKDVFEIEWFIVDVQNRRCQVNLRHTEIDSQGMPVSILRQKDVQDLPGDLQFSAMAANLTTGADLYSEIRQALYSALIAAGHLPAQSEGWVIS